MTSKRPSVATEPQAAGQPAIPVDVAAAAADAFDRVLSGRLIAGVDLAEALRPLLDDVVDIRDRLTAIERALGLTR